MALKNILQHILKEWPRESQQPFKGNPLANYFRSDFQNEIKGLLGERENEYIVEGSAGKGNWANIPWLSILDKDITETTQNGIYPVYLFKGDSSGVYLSLNQGTTIPRQELGGKEASKRAFGIIQYLLVNVPELTAFHNDTIDLEAHTSLGKSYERPNIASIYYQASNLPSEEKLLDDFYKIIQLYTKVH